MNDDTPVAIQSKSASSKHCFKKKVLDRSWEFCSYFLFLHFFDRLFAGDREKASARRCEVAIDEIEVGGE
jgi:hypothetical protein